MNRRIRLSMLPQPDDVTCGPTCLHAVYDFLGDDIALDQIVDEVTQLPDGGTIAPYLGLHALRRGFGARLFAWDLRVFDPSWFKPGIDLAAKLRRQLAAKGGKRLALETDAYLNYLQEGGIIAQVELTPELLVDHLDRGKPMLAGLSATYLYGTPRERPSDEQFDDIDGRPAGHFVVLRGYDPHTRMVAISDPMGPAHEPLHPFGGQEYEVSIERVIGAIMLGVLTRDANLLVIEPRKTERLTAE